VSSLENCPVAQAPFTAFVVSFNERRHLSECLDSVAFCDQSIVVDLGSTDGSLKIAARSGAEIIHRKRVPIVEQVRKEGILYARNDWIIFLDPDEVFPTASIPDLLSNIEANPSLAMIKFPWQFYFKGNPLRCTIWGRNNVKPALVHKNRVSFSSAVHRGLSILPSYNALTFPKESRYVIKHYWIDSYKDLFEKHLRYLKHEGHARFSHGERFSFRKLIKEPLSALKYNLLYYHGLQGGALCVFLSFFYASYVFCSLCSLWKYEKHYHRDSSDLTFDTPHGDCKGP
jgi:glycosyltransferase involved in cell wall biosynthesis